MPDFNNSCPTSNEPVSKADLNKLEAALDKLFKKIGLDIEFTRHFLDRLNDARNKKQITICELSRLFYKVFKKYGMSLANIKNVDMEAVLNDISTEINVPFVMKMNRKNGALELVSKTIMRKKDFKTPDKKLRVESFREYYDRNN